ncbi:hypothetical protein [Arthrobacter sp. L77]|uniref:hypothetical protein n=1 Tax=Arthrobacter sp. L77 TaxID=1496689 RepID=UPI000A6D589B|nr:hypothetical protein [Arthrobacter sp. L77]
MTHDKQHPLADPASPVFGILSTAIIGAVPLIDASRLDDRQRRAVHVGTAVLTGLYIGVTVGGTRLPLRVLAGLAAAAAALRFADVSDVIDARLEEKLRRAGTRHPRRWMAAGTAAFTVAGFLSDRAAARRAQVRAMLDDEPEQVRPLDPRVRGLLEGIPGAGGTAGARELRAQPDHLAAETPDRENAGPVDSALTEGPDPSEAVYTVDSVDGTSPPIGS